MDVLVFTFGLTEAWTHKKTGTVYPTAPGIVAGTFDPDQFELKNFGYNETMESFRRFVEIVTKFRDSRPFNVLLTVSPVPLVATATGGHVLPATVYSKSVLRAVAGDLEKKFENIDYFPSYEIFTNPAARSSCFESNLRTVEQAGVDAVMNVFFSNHKTADDQEIDFEKANIKNADASNTLQIENDIVCEEELLEGPQK
jgi:hypothetical protein